MFRILVCLVLFAGGTSFAIAQEAGPKPGAAYTLSSLVDIALRQSDFLNSFQASLDEKKAAASQARAWQNPTLGFSAGQKTIPGDRGLLYDLSLTQPLFFPGKQRLRGEIGALGTDLAAIERKEAELTLTATVVELAYEYVNTQRKIELVQSRQKRFKLVNSYLAGHLFAAPQQKAERVLIETRLRNISTDALQTEGAQKALFEKLKLYIGWNEAVTPAIQVPWLKGNGAVPSSDWLNLASSQNLEVTAQRVAVESARKEKQLNAKEPWPDVSVSAFYGEERVGGNEKSIGGGLSFPLPLLNRNQNGIRSSEYRVKSEEYRLKFIEQKLKAAMGEAIANVETAKAVIRNYPESDLADIDSKLKGSENEFRKGRLNLLTFLELDSELADTYGRSLDAQVEFVRKLLELFVLAGDREIASKLTSF